MNICAFWYLNLLPNISAENKRGEEESEKEKKN